MKQSIAKKYVVLEKTSSQYQKVIIQKCWCKMQKVEWVDNTKGIGIILVVLAHVLNQVGVFSPIHIIIYTFHMPMFFILSGYTMSSRKVSMNGKEVIIKYLKSLGIPYCIFTILNIIIRLPMEGSNLKRNLLINIYYLLTFQGKGATWFLSALLFASIITVYVIKKFEHKSVAFLTFSVLVCVIISMRINVLHFPSSLLMFPIRTIVAVPFVIYGYLLKEMKIIKKIFDKYMIGGVYQY